MNQILRLVPLALALAHGILGAAAAGGKPVSFTIKNEAGQPVYLQVRPTTSFGSHNQFKAGGTYYILNQNDTIKVALDLANTENPANIQALFFEQGAQIESQLLGEKYVFNSGYSAKRRGLGVKSNTEAVVSFKSVAYNQRLAQLEDIAVRITNDNGTPKINMPIPIPGPAAAPSEPEQKAAAPGALTVEQRQALEIQELRGQLEQARARIRVLEQANAQLKAEKQELEEQPGGAR